MNPESFLSNFRGSCHYRTLIKSGTATRNVQQFRTWISGSHQKLFGYMFIMSPTKLDKGVFDDNHQT